MFVLIGLVREMLVEEGRVRQVVVGSPGTRRGNWSALGGPSVVGVGLLLHVGLPIGQEVVLVFL